jgi:adenylate cyclase
VATERIERLDRLIYDIRLRATMPRTLDSRVVIVDVDDASLAREGQWPWPRDKMARLTTELLTRQQVAVLGFDVMFLEPDRSSGLDRLREIATGRCAACRGWPPRSSGSRPRWTTTPPSPPH